MGVGGEGWVVGGFGVGGGEAVEDGIVPTGGVVVPAQAGEVAPAVADMGTVGHALGAEELHGQPRGIKHRALPYRSLVIHHRAHAPQAVAHIPQMRKRPSGGIRAVSDNRGDAFGGVDAPAAAAQIAADFPVAAIERVVYHRLAYGAYYGVALGVDTHGSARTYRAKLACHQCLVRQVGRVNLVSHINKRCVIWKSQYVAIHRFNDILIICCLCLQYNSRASRNHL